MSDETVGQFELQTDKMVKSFSAADLARLNNITTIETLTAENKELRDTIRRLESQVKFQFNDLRGAALTHAIQWHGQSGPFSRESLILTAETFYKFLTGPVEDA